MLRMKRSGGPSTPKFMLTDEGREPDADPREELARMLTSPSAVRARHGESVLVEADGLRHRRARR